MAIARQSRRRRIGKTNVEETSSKTVGHFLKMLQHIKSWQKVQKVFSNVGLALFN